MVSDNTQKQAAGANFQAQLKEKFKSLHDEGILTSVTSNRNFPHPNFDYANQYKINFVLETFNSKFILIRSTNSYKQDRLKTHNHDIEGVKTRVEFKNKILASILLFPDDQIKYIESLKRDVREGKRYTPASHIFTESECIEFIQNFRDKNIRNDVFLKGRKFALKGLAMEKDIVGVLNQEVNLISYKQQHATPYTYSNILDKILEDYNVNKSDLSKVIATNQIKNLASGGSPKTDIIVTIDTKTTNIVATISVKTSPKDNVSCHEYSTNDFARVLDNKDMELEKYLNIFVKDGGIKKFTKTLNETEDLSINLFKTVLKHNSKVLCEWALTGEHDIKNLTDRNNQISRYIAIAPVEGELYVHRMDKYIDFLINNHKSGQFNTPFKWTVPSKNKAGKIQLKTPLIYDISTSS